MTNTPISLPPASQDDNNSFHVPLKGYEGSDVNSWGIGVFGIGLAAGIALVFWGLFLLFRFFGLYDPIQDGSRRRQEPAAASLVHAASGYRGPLLQVAAEEDLKTLLAARDRALNSYGWIDKPSGIVRIPIDRAIELIAQRGLPPTSPGVSLESLQRQRGSSGLDRQNSPP
jgi:hypothetical protein